MWYTYAHIFMLTNTTNPYEHMCVHVRLHTHKERDKKIPEVLQFTDIMSEPKTSKVSSKILNLFQRLRATIAYMMHQLSKLTKHESKQQHDSS